MLAHEGAELQELRDQLAAARAARSAAERRAGELEGSLVAQERLVAALRQQGASGAGQRAALAAAEGRAQVRGGRRGGSEVELLRGALVGLAGADPADCAPPPLQELEAQLGSKEQQLDSLRQALGEAQAAQQRAEAQARGAAAQLADAEQRFRDLEALMTRIAARAQ